MGVVGEADQLYLVKQKLIIMYKLDCSYYTKEFTHLDELINDCIQSGMDPNYDVLYNGVPCGLLIDLIQF